MYWAAIAGQDWKIDVWCSLPRPRPLSPEPKGKADTLRKGHPWRNLAPRLRSSAAQSPPTDFISHLVNCSFHGPSRTTFLSVHFALLFFFTPHGVGREKGWGRKWKEEENRERWKERRKVLICCSHVFARAVQYMSGGYLNSDLY